MAKRKKSDLTIEKMSELDRPLDESVRELTREEIRELKRRAADFDNPIRYAVFSSFTHHMRWKVWHDSECDCYCNEIEGATLYKRYIFADAMRRALEERSSGANNRFYVAKLTTKNERRRVLKYDCRS